MSWSVQANVTNGNLEVTHRQPQSGYGELESQTAISAAVGAVTDLLKTGIVGDGPVSVRINGHSNPNYQPASNYAKDYVTISIERQ